VLVIRGPKGAMVEVGEQHIPQVKVLTGPHEFFLIVKIVTLQKMFIIGIRNHRNVLLQQCFMASSFIDLTETT